MKPRFDADTSIDVEAPSSYDFLGIDEPVVEDESSHLYSSLDTQHASVHGSSIVSDSIIVDYKLKIFRAKLKLHRTPPWNDLHLHLLFFAFGGSRLSFFLNKDGLCTLMPRLIFDPGGVVLIQMYF